MSQVKIQGNASGTGIFTIASPNSNSNQTLTLPDSTGTVQVSGNPISGTTGTFSGAVSGTTGSFSSDLSFNSGYGSSAVAYGCRAWVNFNGTGTVAIRASGNVSSITDNGTGAYTVNFTNAMPDANYAGVIMTGVYFGLASNDASAPTTSAFAFIVRQSNSPASSTDPSYVHVAIFR
jgi:hypothetical protein